MSDPATDGDRARAERGLGRLMQLSELAPAYNTWANLRFSTGDPPEPGDIYSAYYDVLWDHVRRVLLARDAVAATQTFAFLEDLLADTDSTVQSAVVTEVAYPLAGSGDTAMIELAHDLAGPRFNDALISQEELLDHMSRRSGSTLRRGIAWLRHVLSRRAPPP